MKVWSTQEKLHKLSKLKEQDVNDWEWKFIRNILMWYSGNMSTLTGPQLDKIDEIFERHFLAE